MVGRQKPWTALQALALRHGWDARITHAHDDQWCSVALRARSESGRRVIALWRGRDLEHMRFTSAMTWVEGAHMSPSGPREYFHAVSAAELREVLRGPR